MVGMPYVLLATVGLLIYRAVRLKDTANPVPAPSEASNPCPLPSPAEPS